jgi:hypothetical protein
MRRLILVRLICLICVIIIVILFYLLLLFHVNILVKYVRKYDYLLS